VALNARHAAEVPVKILVSDDPTGLTLSVTDAGPAAGPGPDDLSEELLSGQDAGEAPDPDVALAVLTGLVDEVAIEPAETGTTVTMRWPLPPGSHGPGGTAASQS
jgi:anti-sigma regulatory factor (Ser/Thr protein kinase)